MYERLYYLLFNRITDAVNAIEEGRIDDALKLLNDAQAEAEEQFIEEE